MNRTPGDTSRRVALADAASGLTSRATVVLYACVAPGQEQADVLAQLRQHAEARDWVVVGEVLDHTATATPLDCRPNWSQVKQYITTRQAAGIVATVGTERVGAISSPPLTDWLDEHRAFLSEYAPVSEGV